MRIRTIALLCALGALPAAAQGAPPAPPPASVVAADTAAGLRLLPMAVVGLVGGVVGAVAGLYGGMLAYHGCGGFLCELDGAVVGSVVGATALIPVGVHLGNQGRGNLPVALAASAAVALGGLLLTGNADDVARIEEQAFYAISLSQIVAAMLVEWRTARRSAAPVTPEPVWP